MWESQGIFHLLCSASALFSTEFSTGFKGCFGDEESPHNGDEFSHDHTQCDRAFSAALFDSFVDSSQFGASPDRGHGGHVERFADPWISLLAHFRFLVNACAGLYTPWRDAGISRGLAGPRKAAQVTHLRQDHDGGNEGDTWDAGEQLVVPLEVGGRAKQVLDLLLDAFDSSLELLSPLLLY